MDIVYNVIGYGIAGLTILAIIGRIAQLITDLAKD